MTIERRPDEVDALKAERAAEDPLEVLRRRVAALERDVRRATALRARAERDRRMTLSWILIGLSSLSLTLPWFSGTAEEPSHSFITAFARPPWAVMLVTTVLLPAAFAAVLAWRYRRIGGALLLAMALYLVPGGFRHDAAAPQPGPLLAAIVLVVSGIWCLVSGRDEETES